MTERKCSNCKHIAFMSWSGIDYCMGYEMEGTEDDPGLGICDRYEEGKLDCYEEEHYCPSATAGDYGPGNPWDAPGCSINMFI